MLILKFESWKRTYKIIMILVLIIVAGTCGIFLPLPLISMILNKRIDIMGYLILFGCYLMIVVVLLELNSNNEVKEREN